MIRIQQNTLAYEFLSILAYVGEFPYASIFLFGNKDVWRKLVSKLSQEQTYRVPNYSDRITGRLLNLSGEKKVRTIRLSQKGVFILSLVNPDAANYYARVFGNVHLSGAADRIDRSHRLAESVAFFRLVGIETCPFKLPTLQFKLFQKTVLDEPTFYTSHELKHIGEDSVSKVAFSRITGMLFSSGGCYAIYNSRDYRMEWNGRGEGKVQNHLQNVARMNAGQDEMDSAIMLARDYGIAQLTLAFLGNVNRVENRFDKIYTHLHLIPLNSFGARLVKILALPNWKQLLLELLFDDSELAGAGATFGYDAMRDGKYVFSFLDSDIFRLNAFWDTVRVQKYPATVICFPEQVSFLRNYLRDKVSLQTVTMDMVENAIYERCDSNE